MRLQVDRLSFSYGKKAVLREVSFCAEIGEFISVLGPNGVGKTTLFRCILGHLRDYSGAIRVDGTDLKTLSPRQKAARIAYIPQIHRPTFGYAVLDTVLMGTTRSVGLFSSPGKEQKERAYSALERMGIESLAERNFAHISGGEQQLTLIARAIAQDADILIMDEPTSALDYGNQFRVLEQVCSLSQNGYTVILSTHNPQHALTFSGHVIAMWGGRVEADGNPLEVMTPELMQKIYGVTVSFADTPDGKIFVPKRQKGIYK